MPTPVSTPEAAAQAALSTANVADSGLPGNQSGPGPSSSGSGQGPAPTFTPEQQAHINKIVSQRVNEVKNQYQGYDEATRKSQILDGLLRDPEFNAWLQTGSGGQQQMQMQNQQPQNPFGEIEDIQDLVKVLPQMIQQAVQPMLKPYEQMASNLQTMTKATAMNTELQRMSSTLDEQGNLRYPGLHDPMFRAEVERVISEGRAWKLDDAYALAGGDRRNRGADVPSSAFLLPGRMGGGGLGGQQAPRGPDFSNPPQFKRPEDALNFVTERLGIK